MVLEESLDELEGVGDDVALLDPAPVVGWSWKVGVAPAGIPSGQRAIGNWNSSPGPPVLPAVDVGSPTLWEACMVGGIVYVHVPAWWGV